MIEIADGSLETDRGAKREIYAKAGVLEFWIVDPMTNVVLVHRNPAGHVYESVTTVMPSETLVVEGLPAVSIAAATIVA